MSRASFILTFGIVALAACSSGSSPGGTTTGGTGGYTVTISNYTFSPDPIVVPAGATITVKNEDATSAHTATSEASAGSYAPGQASPNGFTFDTGNIDGGTMATISVPASVPSGTRQPYYCGLHQGMMNNPDPVIQVQ